jgi:hypothetical protein
MHGGVPPRELLEVRGGLGDQAEVLRRFGVAHLAREVVYKRVVFKFVRAAFVWSLKPRVPHPLGGGGDGRGGP